MSCSFLDASLPVLLSQQEGRSRSSLRVDETWLQGKSAFGGVLAAASLRAMSSLVDERLRPARSLFVRFCAPVLPGELVLKAQEERSGARVTHASLRALQGGKVVGLASATFAAGRGEDMPRMAASAPAAPAFDDVEPLPPTPLMPSFTQHFEYRFCLGHWPLSGASSAHLGGWLRPRQPCPLDAPLAAALLDALPPAFLVKESAPRPAASVDYAAHFFVPGPGAGDGRALVEVRSTWAEDGYSDEQAELYDETGRLFARCRQLVAVLA
jgi:acyl-CoA thioesterase